VLDADYEQALAQGSPLWVLSADRRPTRWPGRYLLVVDSGTLKRPVWSPLPGRPKPPPKDRHASASGAEPHC
jgi:hypothetical protein